MPFKKGNTNWIKARVNQWGQSRKLINNCANCNKKIKTTKSVNKQYCNRKCWYAVLSKKVTGDGNFNWSGGETIHTNGYILERAPRHPAKNMRGYVYQHRLVLEKKLGRYLKSNEVAHHIDGDIKNNTPENLKVMGVSDHARLKRK